MRDDRTGTLLLFWDYDTQWGADRSRLPGGPKSWGPLEFANTDRLLDLLADAKVRACFAVVGAAALPGARPYHDPAQIRRIQSAGHEVGSHAHRHDWLPGLDARQLRETLARSKAALEQCTGAPVHAFVPPFNQPFDYPGGWSISLSERRAAGRVRTDLRRLCDALGETGYRFCRVAYRPIPLRLAELIARHRIDRPTKLKRIGGVTCVRVNSPGGFGAATRRVLRRCAARGGLVVAWGHPHSLYARNEQHETCLVPFLCEVARLRADGRLRVVTPSDLLPES